LRGDPNRATSPISEAIVSPSSSPTPGIVSSRTTRASARAKGPSSWSIGVIRSSSRSITASASAIERR
jgi:hypothetical protein